MNKAHGHDMISIRMLKLCGDSICKLLRVYEMKDFHWKGKKPMLSLMLNKLSKAIVQFHLYVFLRKYLNACFMTIYIYIYFFFLRIIFLQSNLHGSGDSYMNKLLPINHEIFSAFVMGPKARGIFLDISKVFDKVWHDGLIFRQRRSGTCCEMINILEDFLSNRKQRVVLNDQCSSWAVICPVLRKNPFLGLCYF